MAVRQNPWMPMREFFALVESEGIDLQAAAEELLRSIGQVSRAIKVAGLRRQWDPPSSAESQEWFRADMRWQKLNRQLIDSLELEDEARSAIEEEIVDLREVIDTRYAWRERLPRDAQLRLVPKSAWKLIDSVDPDLTSSWVDDPEEPDEFISVEWLPGTIISQFWFEHEAYEALCVDRTQAMNLIRRIGGRAELTRELTLPGNRQLDHAAIELRALKMIEEQPTLSIGSAAASIVAELKPNPKTGKQRDQRHIERMIAHLWGGFPESPP